MCSCLLKIVVVGSVCPVVYYYDIFDKLMIYIYIYI